MPEIEIHYPDGLVGYKTLTPDAPLVVGSGSGCDVQIDAPEVAKKHFLFRWSNSGNTWRFDVGKEYDGVQINGKPSKGETIGPDDEVSLGDYTFIFRDSGAARPVEDVAAMGPFFAQERRPDRILYLANSRYLDPGKPVLKQVTESRYATPEERFRALQEGEVEMVGFVPFRNLPYVKNLAGVKTVKLTAPKLSILQINFDREALRKPALRRAMVYAIDRMKEDEMRQVACWILEVLRSPNDSSVADRVRGDIRALCATFPVPGLESLHDEPKAYQNIA